MVCYRLRRWARGPESQALQDAKEAPLVGKGQPRREAGELLRRRGVAEQDRDAAAVLRAFHVDRGVADKPYLLAGHDPARRHREMDRLSRTRSLVSPRDHSGMPIARIRKLSASWIVAQLSTSVLSQSKRIARGRRSGVSPTLMPQPRARNKPRAA